MAAPAPLERLLDLRRSLERQEEMRLALVAGRLHSAGAEVAHAQAERRRAGPLAGADEANGAELQAGSLWHAAACERERRLVGVLAEVQAAHDQQRQALLERVRERKILEALLDRRLAVRMREQLRREQRALDEGFLLRNRPAAGDSRDD